MALTCTTTRAASPRHEFRLAEGWRTTLATEDAQPLFAAAELDDHAWQRVNVPHNWDSYDGFRQTRHGNRHGAAWYRHEFTVSASDLVDERRVFLYFEGVGSYATVWVNGREVGRHAGGLTTFTLDVTDAVRTNEPNLLAVRAEHPAGIRDLPWVCGGCEQAYGFSEGSQPFGIFRPAHVQVTAPVRIIPFGVHAWNGAHVDTTAAVVHVRTDLTNHGNTSQNFALETRLLDARGEIVAEASSPVALAAGASFTIAQDLRLRAAAKLWSPEQPYLYTIQSDIRTPAVVLDRVETPYGIRWIEWPDLSGPPDQPFRVNDEPVFINGVADYEHQLGASHAFTDEQVRARVQQIEAAGFNAFRDAHHPHNLRFNEHWDTDGVLWWTQFGAHIWFENEAFKANYKALLRDWVRERRNSPSLVMWGLQNESKLPAAFAAECAAIIRELDPTASSQRLITTCNGGEGTDWNVPQNWSGTYGGDPLKYAEELRAQRFVGEYGAWRSLGFHSEPEPVPADVTRRSAGAPPTPPRYLGGYEEHANGPLSEERMAALLETKLRLAETVRDRVAGHFMWPFTSHANPGRNFGEKGEQWFDGIRDLDRIGPANNKGLFTIWGEPTDAFQMYRANYARAATQPMVYIVSHTWPDRWTAPGNKSGIVVYSNCDEIELFNDLGARSLGIRKRSALGTHFQWDNADIATNVLYAEGRVGGKAVAGDITLLHHLPVGAKFAEHEATEPAVAPLAGNRSYLYRVNCGGPEYTDASGNSWQADREYKTATSAAWGYTSWAQRFPRLPPAFGSQRKVTDPIAGTRDDALFQTYRYGRDDLRYVFNVPEGEYDVELFFIEPWYLAGGGANCAGWRVFDVAVNGETRLRDVDLWCEASDRVHAIRKVVTSRAANGRLVVSFPRIIAGQAVISAIAISTAGPESPIAGIDNGMITRLRVHDAANADRFALRTHLDNGDAAHDDAKVTFCNVPWSLLEADWVQTARASAAFSGAELLRFTVSAPCDVLVAHDARVAVKPRWLATWERAGLKFGTSENSDPGFELFRRRFAGGDTVVLGANSDSPAIAGAMYAVIAKPVRPSAPPTIIRDFTASPGADWHALGNLQAGQAQYGDRTTIFTSVPSALSDSDWVRTTSAPASDVAASFNAVEPIEVYVALDVRSTARPAWLREWIETNLVLNTSDPVANRFLLWKRRFAPGTRIELGPNAALPGGNAAAMYTVIVRGVRPASPHAATAVSASVVEWTITVGVGDRYGLNITYALSASASAPAELAVINPDGAVFCTRPLEFAPTGGATQVLRTRTCESINAGTYRIRLTSPRLAELQVSTLEVE